jgi:integrase
LRVVRDRLRPVHLDQLYTALLDDGYSPATVLRHHRILSRALTVAVQCGHVPRNVTALVDPPSQRQSDIVTALNLEEARAVLEATWGTRNSARWTVALALGLRQSEALALQWKDIDLLANTLTVRRSIHRVRGGLIYEEPKTRRSQRTLALPIPLVATLHEHKAAQLGEQMLAGSEWHDEDLVFAQPNGRPIDEKSDYDDWTALLQKAGVRHVRLHDGRHTAATLLLSENIHPRVVMELLGHSQTRTTMDIYSHVMPALAREAADRMGPCCCQATAGQLQPQLQPRRARVQGTLKKALVKGVELRGLEPLTPTLPGRLGGVRGSPPSSICAGQPPV